MRIKLSERLNCCRNGHSLEEENSFAIRERRNTSRKYLSRKCLQCERNSTAQQRRKMRLESRCERCRKGLDRDGVVCVTCLKTLKQLSRKHYQANRLSLLEKQKQRPPIFRLTQAKRERLGIPPKGTDWRGIESAMVKAALERMDNTR